MTPAGSLDAEGVWREARRDLAWAAGRPSLFLDRDGVVVEEVNYLCRAEDVALLPEAAELIAEANRRGIPVIVASNQAGIARGYFAWPAFHEVQAELDRRLHAAGARVDLTLACPHYPDHPDRKPRPGMFHKAARIAGLDLARSWVIGDKASDLEAGRAAGLAGGILVLTGHGPAHREAALALATPAFPVTVANSIREARYLLDRCQADFPGGSEEAPV